jgi:hypothetical protein
MWLLEPTCGDLSRKTRGVSGGLGTAYKTAALPLSYASLNVLVCKPIPTLLSENLTSAYEAVKRTRGVTRGLPHSGHNRNQHHRTSSSGLCPRRERGEADAQPNHYVVVGGGVEPSAGVWL